MITHFRTKLYFHRLILKVEKSTIEKVTNMTKLLVPVLLLASLLHFGNCMIPGKLLFPMSLFE